jgi:hypothetical protein
MRTSHTSAEAETTAPGTAATLISADFAMSASVEYAGGTVNSSERLRIFRFA